MIERVQTTCLITPDDIEPSRPDMEVVGVFNPAAVRDPESGDIVLIARVAERPWEARPGYVPLPRYDIEADDIAVDWTPADDLDMADPRVVTHKPTGRPRLTFVSHLRVMHSADGRAMADLDEARVYPATPAETFGIEDPRITRIRDAFYITYVAVSGHGVVTSLMATRDFQTFERLGPIFCPENKDVVLFPEQIDGQYLALHRPNPHQQFTPPEIWIARSPDLLHWGAHAPFYSGGAGQWDAGRIGMGPPPVRVDEGWLAVYHGMSRPPESPDLGVYCAGALLLDADDPTRVLARSAEPFFMPTEEFESHGFVSAVVFPTGIATDGPHTLLYYGAADQSTGLAEFRTADIVESLQSNQAQ